MNDSRHIGNDQQPASAARGIRPKSRKVLKLTIAVDGTWFTVYGDERDDSGFDIRIASDGSNADVTIRIDEADSPLPAPRLYLGRPA